METIRRLITQNPRLAAALAFGISTTALTHFAWYQSARFSGMTPALTLGAGFTHALAGAITGARLFDPRRTQTSLHAALLGAGTSLLGLAMIAPALAIYVSSTNVAQPSVLGYASLVILTGFFTFLAVGWAQLLLSVGIGWGLYRLATADA